MMNASVTSTATAQNRFPRMSLAFQRLCWKETLQIAPLGITLLVINALLHLPLSSNATENRGFHFLLLQLMPCFFASGVGALLVSLEKEQRTISWLSSLPIASSQILRAKFFVSLASLAVFWLACVLVTVVVERGLPSEWVFPRDGGYALHLSVINSIFLTLLGIATAWRWQTPLVALAMIVPLATMGQLVLMAIQGLSRETRLPDYLIAVTYLCYSGLALWYGWRSGQAYLKSRPQGFMGQSMLQRFERTGSRGHLLNSKPQGLAATLVWQFSLQNRMIVVAIIALCALPLLLLAIHAARGNVAVVAIAAWLVVSWLGASVFQSDSVHQRIKFLAERGVAPSTVWWTRQIIPLGLLAVASIIAAVLVWVISHEQSQASQPNNRSYPLMMLGIPAGLLAHAIAQWLGQLVRSPIVSLILAPAVTFSAAAYLAFAIFEIGVPYWILLAPLPIAFIATRVMTQPWMDGRIGLKYLLSHSAFLLVAVLLPLMPLLGTYFTYPGMPSGVAQRFLVEARTHPVMSSPFEVVLPARKPSIPENQYLSGMAEAGFAEGAEVVTEDGLENQPLFGNGGEPLGASLGLATAATEQRPLGFVEHIKQNVASIEAQLASRTGAISWSQAVGFLSAEAVLTRAQLDLDPTNEASKERFQTAARMLVDIVKRLRMSYRLIDQEFADRLEKWMYQQVTAKDGRALLGEANWSAATTLLSDKAGRMAARRHAIVQSYFASGSYFSFERSRSDLGGMMMAVPSAGLAGWRGNVANKRRLGRAAGLLFEFLESKDQNDADKRFAEFAAYWGYPAATRNLQVGISHEAGLQIPGQNWFGEWENYRRE
jgi:ABC-2 family transporter protein